MSVVGSSTGGVNRITEAGLTYDGLSTIVIGKGRHGVVIVPALECRTLTANQPLIKKFASKLGRVTTIQKEVKLGSELCALEGVDIKSHSRSAFFAPLVDCTELTEFQFQAVMYMLIFKNQQDAMKVLMGGEFMALAYMDIKRLTRLARDALKTTSTHVDQMVADAWRALIELLGQSADVNVRRMAKAAVSDCYGLPVTCLMTCYLERANTFLAVITPKLAAGHVYRSEGSVDKLTIDSASTLRMCMARPAFALCLMHAHGYLHMDVKPQNMLYDHDMNGALEIRLADFGLLVGPTNLPTQLKSGYHFYPYTICPPNHRDRWATSVTRLGYTHNLTLQLPRNIDEYDPRSIGICCDWFGFYIVLSKFRDHLEPLERKSLEEFGDECQMLTITDEGAVNYLSRLGIVVPEEWERPRPRKVRQCPHVEGHTGRN